jgi:fatty-acyl-CoA synthase
VTIGTKVFITTAGLNERSHVALLEHLVPEMTLPSSVLPTLTHVIVISTKNHPVPDVLRNFLSFHDLPTSNTPIPPLHISEHDVVNLQFTSGTTGSPKAAMLTHQSPPSPRATNPSNIINNGYFIGLNMALTPADKVCVPPPLFHCFGLVLGNLAAWTHGACAVYASETFSPGEVLRVVGEERCTALHGVPTMFVTELDHPEFEKYDYSSLRYGLKRGRLM